MFEELKQDLTIPGTTILIDKNGIINHPMKKTKNGEKSDIILIPQPSSDPNDPLNWSRRWKNINFIILFLFTLINASASHWTSSVYTLFTVEFEVPYTKLNTGGGIQYLILAFSCLLSQPMANKFGRKPTFLLATILALVGSIIFSCKKDYGGYIIYSIFIGLAVAPMDTIVQVSINDIFYLNEHGFRMSLYCFALGIGSTMGGFVSGLVASNLPTWSWCNYILIILTACLLIVALFFLEESLYHREKVVKLVDNEIDVVDSIDIEKGGYGRDDNKENQVISIDGNDNESIDSSLDKQHIKQRVESIDSSLDKQIIQQKVESIDSTIEPENDLQDKVRKNLIQRISIISLDSRNTSNLISLTISPIKTLRYPGVIYGSIIYGIQICWLSLFGVTLSQFYSVEPYEFLGESIGYLNLSGLIGSIFGLIYLMINDPFQIWKARKNNGIAEPEDRLLLSILPIIINTLGLFLYGFGPYYKMHWIVGALGMGLTNFGIFCLSTLSLTYVLESYPKQALKTMVAVLFIRNIIGAIFTWVFQDWLNGVGTKGTIIMLGVFCFVINGSVGIMLIYGKAFRKWTKVWYEESIQD